MTITSTTTDITIASSILDDLVAGTYTTVRVQLTTSGGTSYTVDLLAADVTVNAGDDSYAIQPTIISTTTTVFPDDYYTVTLLTGTLFDVTSDANCILQDETIACTMYEAVKKNLKRPSDKRTEFHLIHQSLLNTTDCDSCDCATATEMYIALIRDLGDEDYIYIDDCGCS